MGTNPFLGIICCLLKLYHILMLRNYIVESHGMQAMVEELVTLNRFTNKSNTKLIDVPNI